MSQAMTEETDRRRDPVYWIGEVPQVCQLSKVKITDSFVDGFAPGTGWAFVHPAHYRKIGGKFGTGRGQRYVKQANGRWLKVEG